MCRRDRFISKVTVFNPTNSRVFVVITDYQPVYYQLLLHTYQYSHQLDKERRNISDCEDSCMLRPCHAAKLSSFMALSHTGDGFIDNRVYFDILLFLRYFHYIYMESDDSC